MDIVKSTNNPPRHKPIPPVLKHLIETQQYIRAKTVFQPDEINEVNEINGIKSLKKREKSISDRIAEHILGLETNTLRVIKIKDICKEFKINPSFLSRKFKKEKKYTLCDFIQQVKIQRAATLLQEDYKRGKKEGGTARKSLSIEALSSQLGYSSTEYFIRCFKKRMGVPPNTFRKCLNLRGKQPLSTRYSSISGNP
ncbi:MAG: helix-turn-helix transcriptional regulator [bacterium]|nr:helix-turn-helix transcriptional regulator [bacterium]